MNLVPPVRNNVAPVHVGGHRGLEVGSRTPGPRVRLPLFGGQIPCKDEITALSWELEGFLAQRIKVGLAHGVAQPGTLAVPGGEQEAAAVLVGLLLLSLIHI